MQGKSKRILEKNYFTYKTLLISSTTIQVTFKKENLLSCCEIKGPWQMAGATQCVGGPKSKIDLLLLLFSLYVPTGSSCYFILEVTKLHPFQ